MLRSTTRWKMTPSDRLRTPRQRMAHRTLPSTACRTRPRGLGWFFQANTLCTRCSDSGLKKTPANTRCNSSRWRWKTFRPGTSGRSSSRRCLQSSPPHRPGILFAPSAQRTNPLRILDTPCWRFPWQMSQLHTMHTRRVLCATQTFRVCTPRTPTAQPHQQKNPLRNLDTSCWRFPWQMSQLHTMHTLRALLAMQTFRACNLRTPCWHFEAPMFLRHRPRMPRAPTH